MKNFEKIAYYGGRFLIGWAFFSTGLLNLFLAHYNIGLLFSGHAPFAHVLLGAIIVIEIIGGFMLAVGLKRRLTVALLLVLVVGLTARLIVHTPINSWAQVQHHAASLIYHGAIFGILLFMYSHPRN